MRQLQVGIGYRAAARDSSSLRLVLQPLLWLRLRQWAWQRGHALLASGIRKVTISRRRSSHDETTTPVRLEEFLGLSQNSGFNIFNLCDPEYGLKLQSIAEEITHFADEDALNP